MESTPVRLPVTRRRRGLNEVETPGKNNNSNRKRLLRIVLVTAVVLLVLAGLSGLIQWYENWKQTAGTVWFSVETDDYVFAPADYEEDIYTDDEYLALDREIHYKSGGLILSILLDEDGTGYGKGFFYFQTYFRAILDGDYSAYLSCFAKDYADLENNVALPKKAFTPQKLYDISLDYREGDTVILSESESRSYYVIKYKIKDNNGTFRKDIESDEIRPLLAELTEINGELSITRMVFFVDN